MRLNEGFNGRPDKKDDTCYTFWVGATLKLLNEDHPFANAQILRCLDFVLSTQDGITGGLAKWPEISPDPLHTYLGLAGLALAPYAGLRPVDPQLNITKRARAFVDNLHNLSWNELKILIKFKILFCNGVNSWKTERRELFTFVANQTVQKIVKLHDDAIWWKILS